MKSRLQRMKRFAVVITILAVGTACIPQFGTPAGPLTYGILTPDGNDTYLIETNGATTTFRTPTTNQDGNLRLFFWNTSSPFVADEESCNRWDSVIDVSTPAQLASVARVDMWQPGVGLRIAPTPDGKFLRGISLDLNVWGDAWWVLQVIGWDTTNPSNAATPLVSFDLSPIVAPSGPLYAPPPWSICGQVFGDTLRVKVWVGNNPEPSWDDPTHVFTATIPSQWDYAGYPGGYVAHIAPATQKKITTLRTGALMPDGSYPQ